MSIHIYVSSGQGTVTSREALALRTQAQAVASSSSASIHVMSFSSQSVKRSLSLSPVGRKKRALFGDRNRANYLVVKTDYTSYSVVYNCNPVGNILKKGNLSF